MQVLTGQNLAATQQYDCRQGQALERSVTM